MRIVSIQIENYKSFRSSEEIVFSPGFNVIVGKNNSGKTALVEGLSLKFNHKPHTSLVSVPYNGSPHDMNSLVTMKISVSREEAMKVLLEKNTTFQIPQTKLDVEEQIAEINNNLLRGEITIQSHFNGNDLAGALWLELGDYPSNNALTYSINKDDLKHSLKAKNSGKTNNVDFAHVLAAGLKEKIYFFVAERLKVGQQTIGINRLLAPDASNLAEVLHHLHTSNTSRFNRIVDYLRIVFPDIKGVTTPVMDTSASQTEIKLWFVAPNSEREDLAQPLQESGTGVGQVLSILYVVLETQEATAIIIDEPQSFLHPGALRRLFSILKNEFSDHQYIVTTHSPNVISSSSPNNIIMVTKEESVSITTIIDQEENNQMRLVLAEVGASLSDVFGADHILWVEGKTEEICFTILVTKILRRPLLGTAIVGVIHVGDFENKRYSKTIFEIYERLSKAKGLLPPAIGFIFDKENRSKEEIRDFQRRSKGRISFTSRRMYENYLLNINAIVVLINSIDEERDQPVSPDDIEKWIKTNKWNNEYFGKNITKSDKNEEFWITNVHGANILADIVRHFTENRYEYEKILYGEALTESIIEHSPEEFDEIAQLIKEKLEGSDN